MAEIKKEYLTGDQKNLKRVVFKLSKNDEHILPVTAEEWVRDYDGLNVIIYDISVSQPVVYYPINVDWPNTPSMLTVLDLLNITNGHKVLSFKPDPSDPREVSEEVITNG